MPTCPPTCPKVRRDLRKAVAELARREGYPQDAPLADFAREWMSRGQKRLIDEDIRQKTSSRDVAVEKRKITYNKRNPEAGRVAKAPSPDTESTSKALSEDEYSKTESVSDEFEEKRFLEISDSESSILSEESSSEIVKTPQESLEYVGTEVPTAIFDYEETPVPRNEVSREIRVDEATSVTGRQKTVSKAVSTAKSREVQPQRQIISRSNVSSLETRGTGRSDVSESRNWAHRTCEVTCPLRIARERAARRLEERQRAVDRYLLTKGLNYFEDVCTCSLACIVNTLKRDPFVKSILRSVALFAIGIKLCSELNAWYLPRRIF